MGELKLYKHYRFIGQDPIVGKVRTVLRREGLTSHAAERMSGVASSTINGWLGGRTRRPQHATVMAVLRAAGYDLELTKKE